jgi:hypothetical protein
MARTQPPMMTRLRTSVLVLVTVFALWYALRPYRDGSMPWVTVFAFALMAAWIWAQRKRQP